MSAKPLLALAATVGIVAAASGIAAAGSVQPELASAREATAGFHQVADAEAAGYQEFLDCFDAPAGGQGQHYVDVAAIDGDVEATHPEALVYEVTRDRLQLVGVEYIVPHAAAEDPPELFGRHFHLDTELDVWVLHAWIWKANPTGMFEDWNPNVGPCPS